MPIDKLDIPLVIVEAIRPELARFCYYLENNKDKYPEIFNEKWKDQTEHQQLNYMIMLYFDIYVKNEFKKTYKLLKSRGVKKKLIKDFMYLVAKLHYKNDKGLWSWNEIEEFDIPLDNIKNTTTKYKII